LALVALTCQQSERLRFRYRNGSGQDSRRHVEPYRLVYTGRRWYLVAHDLDKGEWRSFRLDRMEDIRPTGARSRPADPPDAARFVSEGLSSGPYRWRARVLLDAPAAVVAAIGEGQCLLTSGSDSLDMIALHLARLDIPFTPLEPAGLRDRCAVLAERLSQAAHRYPAE